MNNVTYEKVTDPRKRGKIIEKEEAERLIKKEGLVVVCKNEWGVIWDTPDEQFYKTYQGVGKDIPEL